MQILLLTPPMIQLNTPYPATTYLTGFLSKQGYSVFQDDPAIKLFLKLFCKTGLEQVVAILKAKKAKKRAEPAIETFLSQKARYTATIDPVIRFLQGKDPSLAFRVITREFLPEGPRFLSLIEGASLDDIDPVAWAFGTLGIQDRAKYLASLFIDDVADVIRLGIDSRFELSRYAEKLAASQSSFKPLKDALQSPPSLIDSLLNEIIDEFLEKYKPTAVGLTVPFPGNVYGAFRIAQRIKTQSPQIKVLMGSGYVNTELRNLSEPQVFNYVDFISLDDGEKPFLCILEHLEGKRSSDELLRTFILENGKVVLKSGKGLHDIPHRQTGTPTYRGLPLDQYISIFEMLNPMHRIWSDGRWNKLTLAHGCYWRKCNFCDVSLDYIRRYDPMNTEALIDRIQTIIQETGQSGFHFVDEAAPPAILKSLSKSLIEKNIPITWWGNIRFDKVFTPELTRLLAQSGCVAVSGGLEVASDRLLKLMQKGVTIGQVARVTKAFTDAGIMVHAYLMYGFPTQTLQETIDSLERVRQLFQAGCIQSGFWHPFSATTHSPIGMDPEKFGIKILPTPKITFAKNDLPFWDPTECDHQALGEGLKKALYNYMHGVGIDLDVRFWFKNSKHKTPRIPEPNVPADLIEKALLEPIEQN